MKSLGFEVQAAARQAEDKPVFGYISMQASSVTTQPRPDASLEATSARSSVGGRRALGQALVALGQRVAGEMPVTMARRPEGDCA